MKAIRTKATAEAAGRLVKEEMGRSQSRRADIATFHVEQMGENGNFA